MQAAADGIGVFDIASGTLRASVLTMGASLFDLSLDLPAGRRCVILKHSSPEAYRLNPHYLGVIAGRCANRIRDGHFQINGIVHQLDRNENGATHLHGGSQGFSRRNWAVALHTATAVELTLHSSHGDQGYPGNTAVSCVYEALPGWRLRITMAATCDADTLMNLAAHAYFNLEPGSSILDHKLWVDAGHYTPVDQFLIPDGRIVSVEGTEFDFRAATRIGDRRMRSPIGYDHNLVLAHSPIVEPRLAATLYSPGGGLAMDILTTEPGLQFYDGGKLASDPVDGNSALGQFAGCCLESQRFPDANHWPRFAQASLRAGQRYRQVTEYVFRPGLSSVSTSE